MFPVWQMVVGVCVGLVVLILTRPQPLEYSAGSSRRSRTSWDTSDPSDRPPKYNAKPGEMCVICLKEMLSDNMTYLRCGHALHTECAGECKKHTDLCPLCREHM